MPRPWFQPQQARVIARVFEAAEVDYLFIGKSGAILLGFPAVTQDVDVFAARSPENGRRTVTALRAAGFEIGPELEQAIVAGKDFVHIKTGPFDLDLVFAPDGIPSFAGRQGAVSLRRGFPHRQSARHHCQQTGQRVRKGPAGLGIFGTFSRGIRATSRPTGSVPHSRSPKRGQGAEGLALKRPGKGLPTHSEPERCRWLMRLALTLTLSPKRGDRPTSHWEKSLNRGPCPAREKLPLSLGRRQALVSTHRNQEPPVARSADSLVREFVGSRSRGHGCPRSEGRFLERGPG